MNTFVVIDWVGFLAYQIYVLSGIILRLIKAFWPATQFTGSAWRGINLAWRWTKWLALAYVVATPALDALAGGERHWWSTLVYLLNGCVWWLYRNSGDDDEWRRKAKRALEAVKQVGHQLVVVPQS